MGRLQHAVRTSLYEAYRHDFGCDDTDEEHLTSCDKHLKIEGLTDPDPAYAMRIRYLTRLEGMRAVGCRFRPNDLSPQTWSELMMLARERQWIDEQVDAHRRHLRESEATINEGLDKARQEGHIPRPGQSIFPRGA